MRRGAKTLLLILLPTLAAAGPPINWSGTGNAPTAAAGPSINQVLVPTGSSAAPSLAPLAGTTTGVWFPSANSMGFVIAGTQKLLLNSLGQLVLGTPAAALGVTVMAQFKMFDDDPYSGLCLEGTGSGGNRIWCFSPSAAGNLDIYNSVANEYALRSSNGGMHTSFGASPGSTVTRAGIGALDSTTSVTDFTTGGGIKPSLSCRNTNATNGNMCGIYGVNSATALSAGLLFVNDNHSATVNTGHVNVLASKTGATILAARFDADRIVLPILPQAGNVTADSLGVLGTVAYANVIAQPVGSTGQIGTSTMSARVDHVHQGVHSVNVAGYAALYGDMALAAGAGQAIAQSGTVVTFSTSGTPSPNGALSVATSYSIVANDDIILFAGTAPATRNLPRCSTLGSNKDYVVFNDSDYDLTVYTHIAETFNVDGTSVFVLPASSKSSYNFTCLQGAKYYVH